MSYSYKNISVMYYPGTVCAYLGSTDIDGWVICDGIQRNVSDSRYTNLVTMAIGTGTANAYTPPDYRGAFLRGSNKGTANAAATTTYGARAPDLKISQTHMTETHSHGASSGNQSANHTHTGTTDSGGSHTHTISTSASPDHTHGSGTTSEFGDHTHTMKDAVFAESGFGGEEGNLKNKRGSNSGWDNNNDRITVGTRTIGINTTNHTHTFTTDANTTNHTHSLTITANATNHTHTITTNSDPVHNHTITINNSTTNAGSETRPHNYGVNWILKI
uniref:Uncharacterized protein n=1 Tax=viral metagenome TaxID=1070528 RepID=A0A6C0L7T9_9ZZZZ